MSDAEMAQLAAGLQRKADVMGYTVSAMGKESRNLVEHIKYSFTMRATRTGPRYRVTVEEESDGDTTDRDRTGDAGRSDAPTDIQDGD